MRFLYVFLCLSLFGLVSCKPDQVKVDPNVPIFKLTADDVQSWEDHTDALTVVLTDHATSVLKMIGGQFPHKPVAIYLDDAKLIEDVLKEPVDGRLTLTGKALHDNVVPLLPPEKKTGQ